MSQAGSLLAGGSSGGGGINTINGISPDGSGNFLLTGSHGITITPIANGDNVSINNAITLGDLSIILAGSSALTLQSGDLTISGTGAGAGGNINLPTTTANVGTIKVNGSPFIHAFGTNNTFVGSNSGNYTLASSNNVGLGTASLRTLGAGGNNTALGAATLSSLTNGSNNIAIGNTSGNAYTTNESNNILIGNAGVVAESAVTRIGTNGTQTKAFIAGIDGVNVGNVAKVVTESGDQLGTATITAGTNISVTATANTITIAATHEASFVWSVITVNQTAAVNNGYICNKAGTLSLLLPAASVVGDLLEVTGINTATGWQITQAAGQQIFFGTASTTSGASGTITSTGIRDSIRMVCVVANTTWQILSCVGNLTLV